MYKLVEKIKKYNELIAHLILYASQELYPGKTGLLRVGELDYLFSVEENYYVSLERLKDKLVSVLEQLSALRPRSMDQSRVYSDTLPLVIGDSFYCDLYDENYYQLTSEAKELLKKYIGFLNIKKKSRSMKFYFTQNPNEQ